MNIPHDSLEVLLKDDAAAARDAYIDDAGFTARVVGALPARRGLSRAIRSGVPFTFAMVSATMVMCCTAAGSLAVDAFMDLATETMTANAVGLLLVIVVVIAASAASVTADA